jgi:2-oxo-4-hydroxy-4-carboxy-5-ureidoimidazoline decarboxylase
MNAPIKPALLTSQADFETICTSCTWQTLVLQNAPFTDKATFVQAAERAFDQLTEPDWLEAFAGHPMIGDIKTLEAKYGAGKALSESEQSQVERAPQTVLLELLKLNQAYQEKFGFIFIVCATGLSAPMMLAKLKARLPNSRAQELTNAANEQRKISRIRMENLL